MPVQKSGLSEVQPDAMEDAKPKVTVTDEVRTLTELRDDPKNPKVHSDRQISQIMKSIETFGYVNKIALRPNNMIIGGHGTRDALKRLGREKIEVRVVHGLTDAQYLKLGLALNKLPEGSKWDDRLLAEVVDELDEAGEGLDLGDLGFGDKELKSLRTGPGEIEVKSIETSQVDDEFWISIRGPLQLQADALKALEAAMKPFEGVTVDLGTIGLGN